MAGKRGENGPGPTWVASVAAVAVMCSACTIVFPVVGARLGRSPAPAPAAVAVAPVTTTVDEHRRCKDAARTVYQQAMADARPAARARRLQAMPVCVAPDAPARVPPGRSGDGAAVGVTVGVALGLVIDVLIIWAWASASLCDQPSCS
jgi:hypothetical protein